MRTMENQLLIDGFTKLGFEAVPMAFPKVYRALADKQVEGQENPLPTILSSRFYEVPQHLTLSRRVDSAFVLLISKATWDSLSAADQRVVAGVAADAREFQRQTDRDVTATGMQVTTCAMRSRCADACAPCSIAVTRRSASVPRCRCTRRSSNGAQGTSRPSLPPRRRPVDLRCPACLCRRSTVRRGRHNGCHPR